MCLKVHVLLDKYNRAQLTWKWKNCLDLEDSLNFLLEQNSADSSHWRWFLGKSKGHYCISQEAAISPNLLKFIISAQLGSRQQQKSCLALGSQSTSRCKWSYFYQANGYWQGILLKPILIGKPSKFAMWILEPSVKILTVGFFTIRFVIEDSGW